MSEVVMPEYDAATHAPLEIWLEGNSFISNGQLMAEFEVGSIDYIPGGGGWSMVPGNSARVVFQADSNGSFRTPSTMSRMLKSSVDVKLFSVGSGGRKELDNFTISLKAKIIYLGNADAVAGEIPDIPTRCIADGYPNKITGFGLWATKRAEDRGIPNPVPPKELNE